MEDDDSDEEEAAARARRPRGARSAVRPGVECPYMDTISRQVRAGCVCVERLPHATDAWGSAGGSAQPCLSTISFSALTCCGPSPARSATEGVRPCRMGRSTLRWPSRTGRAWLCQPGVWCQQRRGGHTRPVLHRIVGGHALHTRFEPVRRCIRRMTHSRFPPTNPDGVLLGLSAAHSCWTSTLRSAAPSTWHPSTSTRVWSAASTTRCVAQPPPVASKP